jgi:alpha-L-fucosidase
MVITMNQKELIERQKWFVNLRLGMFIHFNSATFQFNSTEIKDWEYDHENNGLDRKFPFHPEDFNPTLLDCRQWAKAAKTMGASFAALTTKHHEGFCLWPTKTTEHCIRNAANKTDVVKEYVDAFRSEGVIPGLYYSMLDLTQQINRKKCTREDVAYTKNQLTELLTNYGEIPFIIIDGWQAHWGGPSYENMPYEEIDAHIKSIQPNCMLLNISCESNLNHTEIVFYENAAGQEVEDEFQGPGASCNILNDCWFWRKTDPDMELKSAAWAVDKIKDMNNHNVTFILNSSPNTMGLIDDNFLQRYKEVGERYQKPKDIDDLPSGWKMREMDHK